MKDHLPPGMDLPRVPPTSETRKDARGKAYLSNKPKKERNKGTREQRPPQSCLLGTGRTRINQTKKLFLAETQTKHKKEQTETKRTFSKDRPGHKKPSNRKPHPTIAKRRRRRLEDLRDMAMFATVVMCHLSRKVFFSPRIDGV